MASTSVVPAADSRGMWLWVAFGWCVLGLLLALVHHRLRRLQGDYPSPVAAFVLRLENELARSHPRVQFLGMLPGRFACLLCIDGQETPVGLHEAWRHAQAFPDAFARMVARLVADLGEAGLDRVEDVDFAAAAPILLPQVRSRQWVEAHGAFGDAALVQRPLNEDLVTVYVLDDPQCMVFVCREHLRRWRKSEADVHHLALANLTRRGREALLVADAGQEPILLQSGDGFDAARVLLLEQAEGLLVAIPERDTLWVGRAEGSRLEQLMATTAAIARESARPVSPHVYQIKDGCLAPLPRSD